VPVFDNEEHSSASGGSATGHPHVIGGGCTDTILFAFVSFYTQDVAVDNVTSEAGTFTALPDGMAVSAYAESSWKLAAYYRLGASGTQNVTATLASSVTGVGLTTVSYCAVSQSLSLGTAISEADGDGTIFVSSSAGELVLDAVIGYSQVSTLTEGAGQTLRSSWAMEYMVVAVSEEAGDSVVNTNWGTDDTILGQVGVSLRGLVAAPSARRRGGPTVSP